MFSFIYSHGKVWLGTRRKVSLQYDDVSKVFKNEGGQAVLCKCAVLSNLRKGQVGAEGVPQTNPLKGLDVMKVEFI